MIYVNTCEYQISYEHDGQEWGSWSAEHEFSVSGVHKGKIDGGEAINVCFNYDVGDTVYVLYMRYGSGDSFGHASGNGEVLWVFREKILAEKALERVENASCSHSVTVYDEALNEFRINNPASDYFSNCEGVYIEEFVVEP